MVSLSKFFMLSVVFIGISCQGISQYYKLLWTIKTERDTITPLKKDWAMSFSLGLNASYIKNVNVPGGTSDNGFSGSSTVDLYIKKSDGKFLSSNEFHYQVSFFRAGEKGAAVIKSFDNMTSLHDWSVRNATGDKWNLNFIAKISTPLIKSWKGGLLTQSELTPDGALEKPGNPYDISFAPGFKYIIGKRLNISLSPYALRFYGVTDQDIADRAIYDTGGIDDKTGRYSNSRKEKKGAELNIWWDWNYKERFIFEYRFSTSSKYTDRIFREGLFNGFFTTKIKLISNLYLTHRGILAGIIEQRPLKPEWRQTILLSYSIVL